MKNILITALFSLAAITANAQDRRSEFFYQANESEKFVEANFNYQTTSMDLVGGIGDKYKVSDMVINAAYEIGLTDMYSVYGNIGYGSGNVEVTGIGGGENDITGLNPINIGTKLKYAMGAGTFFGRANLGLGLLGKLDCEGGGDCNRTDNSINMALRFGYLLNLENAFAGLSLDYGVFSTDGKDKDGTSVDKKGGFALTAFYEAILSDMILGGSFTYSRNNSARLANADLFFADHDDADSNLMTLKVYTRAPLSETMSLLGSLSYDIENDPSDDGLERGSGFGANLGLRLSL